jgi:hypothetical protein
MKSIVRSGQVVKGSVHDVSKAQGISVDQALLNVDIIALIDQSGSMGERDAGEGRSRNDAAYTALETLQAQHPGRVAVFEFADKLTFCPGGIPLDASGGMTNLAGALQELHPLVNGNFDLVVVSDGEPDSEPMALLAAQKYTESVIHTIYVGARGEKGELFLKQLAQASRGKAFASKTPGALLPGAMALLGSGNG